MNVALITARAGSKSIIHKNLKEVCDVPLVGYSIKAALNANHIDKVYVSTDGKEIANTAKSLGAEIIWRPESISRDDSPHWECIEHGVNEIEKLNKNVGNVVVLLGNTAMVSSKDIDTCLHKLDIDKNLSGVLTVWKAQDDHPFRALSDDGTGCLKAFPEETRTVTSNRQAYPTVYYYDQGVWAFRSKWAFEKKGPSPWTWMGPQCGYIVRPWVAGRDVHNEFDLEVAKWFVENKTI